LWSGRLFGDGFAEGEGDDLAGLVPLAGDEGGVVEGNPVIGAGEAAGFEMQFAVFEGDGV